MSKYLYLARHGEAAAYGSGSDDHDRPLTENGREEARITGDWLRKQGIAPQAIVASTATRARDTAALLAERTGYRPDHVVSTRRIYDADFQFILDLIFKADDGFDHLLLVGHNPTFTMLGQYLASNAPGHLPTAGLIAIVFEVDSWAEATAGAGRALHFYYPSLEADT